MSWFVNQVGNHCPTLMWVGTRVVNAATRVGDGRRDAVKCKDYTASAMSIQYGHWWNDTDRRGIRNTLRKTYPTIDTLTTEVFIWTVIRANKNLSEEEHSAMMRCESRNVTRDDLPQKTTCSLVCPVNQLHPVWTRWTMYSLAWTNGMSTWGMQHSLTSTEDTAAQRCRFVHGGQQQDTARDKQPKDTHNLPSENSLAIICSYLTPWSTRVVQLVKTLSKVHYRFHKTPLQDCTLKDMNPVPSEVQWILFTLRTFPFVLQYYCRFLARGFTASVGGRKERKKERKEKKVRSS